MPSLPVYDKTKKKVGSIELDDSIFAADVHPHLLNQAVRTQIAHKYEWKTANTLTRSEVKATRQKMYRQKGTGNARHGNETAPIFVGGGKAHGPRPHRARFKTNRAVMRKALISALSKAQQEDRLFVLDKLSMDKHSTKEVANTIKAFDIKSALFVNLSEDDGHKVFNRSSRNLRSVKLLQPQGVNVFDILKYKNVMLSQDAAKALSGRLLGQTSNKPSDKKKAKKASDKPADAKAPKKVEDK